MSTEHEKRIEVGLSNGLFSFAGRRHLPPISVAVRFATFKSANNSKRTAAGLLMSTEHT
jgi:hypothetical protein